MADATEGGERFCQMSRVSQEALESYKEVIVASKYIIFRIQIT